MLRFLPRWSLLTISLLQLHAAAAVEITAAEGERVALHDVEFSNSAPGRQFIERVVGQARVVALGEPHHGGREYLHLRNDMFRYLVETMGFSAIAVESDFALGTAIDDYVMGHGELSDDLVASVFSFAAPDAWAANRELLQWMRAYNACADGRRKIHFYGLEMLGHVLQTPHPDADRPLRAALEYMTSVEPASAAEFRRRTDKLLAQLVSAPYPSEEGASTPYDRMGTTQQDALTVAIADMVSLFQRRHVEWIAISSKLSYERAYRNALNAAALDADFRARGWWISRTGDRAQRDATSARNLQWALEQEGDRGRIMVFAANAHVTTSAQGCSNDASAPRWASMGSHLKQRLGDEMVTIASVGGFAAEQCATESNCRGITQLACLLSTTGESVVAMHPGPDAAVHADGFDAVVYVKDVSSAEDGGGRKTSTVRSSQFAGSTGVAGCEGGGTGADGQSGVLP